jgi:hypothetical protein
MTKVAAIENLWSCRSGRQAMESWTPWRAMAGTAMKRPGPDRAVSPAEVISTAGATCPPYEDIEPDQGAVAEKPSQHRQLFHFAWPPLSSPQPQAPPPREGCAGNFSPNKVVRARSSAVGLHSPQGAMLWGFLTASPQSRNRCRHAGDNYSCCILDSAISKDPCFSLFLSFFFSLFLYLHHV